MLRYECYQSPRLCRRPMTVQDYVLDATKGVEYALKEIGGEGVDATLVATDAIPAYEYGLHITKNHGTFVVIGQYVYFFSCLQHGNSHAIILGRLTPL
jgi:hypothetical protein